MKLRRHIAECKLLFLGLKLLRATVRITIVVTRRDGHQEVLHTSTFSH